MNGATSLCYMYCKTVKISSHFIPIYLYRLFQIKSSHACLTVIHPTVAKKLRKTSLFLQ